MTRPPAPTELAILRHRVLRNRDVDPRREPGFTSQHAALLGDVDNAATVVELVAAWGRAGADTAVGVLLDLLRWGACSLASDRRATTGSDEIPIFEDEATFARPAEPAGPAGFEDEATKAVPRDDATTPTSHDRLLAEDVELDDATRRRILTASVLLREGRVLELLGVGAGTQRAELKRAYYALAKEFHPDRFYGRRLGSFAPMLTQVFEAAAQAIKTLLDQRTVLHEASAAGPQRRRSPRYAYPTPVRFRCESWGQTQHLTASQLGAGGMFVCTDATAAIGERAAFELTLPDQTPLMLSGRIVARVAGGERRPPGLCVQFAPLAEPDRARFTTLLEVAKAAAPTPANQPLETEGRTRLARGSGGVRALAPVVGIDLGTSFVTVSATIGGRVHVLPFPAGGRALPSVVAFPRRGEIVVGAAARDRLARDPTHAIASPKRLLGRKADDREIQGQLASAGYRTLPGPSGEVLFEMWGEPLSVTQVCGYLLDAARAAAEQALGRPVGSAVLTAPVSFGAEKVALLHRAARLAHLEVLEIVDEPSAAALANRFRPESGGLVGVYDFGGGTFDFSVVDTSGGDFRVITTAGDSWLGGDDLDLAVADAVANLAWRANGIDLRQRAVEWQQLLFAVERAKRELSMTDEAQVVVPEAIRTAAGATDLRARIVRAQAERIWKPLIDRSLHTCLQALATVGLAPADLSAIYLSGGTTHIPLVRRSLHQFFGTSPVTGVPPDFAVCLGAGVQAAQLEQLRAPTLRPH